jgi:hypothetical protein
MYTPQGISHHSFQKFFLKTFTLLVLVSGFSTQQVLAQFTENFSDGNFSVNPVWSGSASKFSVVSNQLKLLAPAVNDIAYLSTNSESIHEASWEFTARMEFNPSGTNYANVYLVSDNADLTASVAGYFVSLGSVNDEISLYRQQGNVKTKIIDGVDGKLNLAVVNVKVKVTRSADGKWQLFSDVGNTGTLNLEGSVTDMQVPSSFFSGVFCQYTSTRSDKFYFDDFVVTGLPYQDVDPPVVKSLSVNSSREISILFSEEVASGTTNHENIFVEDLGPATRSVLSADRKTIQLAFGFDFANGIESTLHLSGIHDLAGNEMTPVSRVFLFFQPSAVFSKDVIVTELLPDYEPVVGLPSAEFIELYNRSENPIQLENWTITDGSSTGHLSSKILLPHAYLIVIANSSAAQFTGYANVMPISNFPTLNNSGDQLKLYDGTGALIDSLNYNSQWYRDEDKLSGGWSLELIDPDNFCKREENWIASSSSSGGTPGGLNSVNDKITDLDGPRIISVGQLSDTTIVVAFDERLENTIPQLQQATVSPDPGLVNLAVADDLRSLTLYVTNPIEESRTYKITFSELHDCEGNKIADEHNSAFLNYDTIPPSVDSVVVLSPEKLIVYFSEPMAREKTTDATNYLHVEANANPESVEVMDRQVLLTFAENFPNGELQHIYLREAEDLNANAGTITVEFLYFTPSPVSPLDIVINEIFSDPSPSMGLPDAEFVELYNRSNNPINLEGWTITDRHSTGVIPAMILAPGGYVVLTSLSSKLNFSTTDVLGLHVFPSLNNSRDTVIIKAPDSQVIDSLVYGLTFYHDEDKTGGGWSMELRDPGNTCLGVQNWKASVEPSGGTPGRSNSVFEIVTDTTGPSAVRAEEREVRSIDLVFNEKIMSRLPGATDFTVIPPVTILGISAVDEQTLRVHLADTLIESKTYLIKVTNVYDCPGNGIDTVHNQFRIHYDTVPPGVLQQRVLSGNQIEIVFSEPIDSTQINTSDFQLQYNLANPSEVAIENQGRKIVLTFDALFRNAIADTLAFDVSDINGNSIQTTAVFRYFVQLPYQPKDIIITEIFSDPAPSAGLPDVEYIELFNRSEIPINLAQWKLRDATASAALKEIFLLPGQYVIICSVSGSKDLQGYGMTMGIPNFPGLNNGGEAIVIRDKDGLMIDSVWYSPAWYRDEEASEGGYSLELIDPENICGEGENWIASMDESGGTPGKRNSVFASNPDVTPPAVSAVNVVATNELQIVFNEKLSSKELIPENFVVDGLTIESVAFLDRRLRTVVLRLREQLASGTLYKLRTFELADCAGNVLIESNAITFALAEKPEAGEVLISEILFNPHADGVDFIELFNASEKYIDLAQVMVANYTDSLSNVRMMPSGLFRPNSYLVLTTDIENITKNYPRTVVENCVAVPSLPPMGDDEGTISISDSDGVLLDTFVYSSKFHSPFVQNEEGVSLERISFDQANSPDNWRSASSTMGFATPGFKNSNNLDNLTQSVSPVHLFPQVFESNSGHDDFTNIYYRFDKGGMIGNVRIYDSNGRPIRNIAENISLATEGFFRWDGDADNGSKVSIGYYMVFFEVFDVDGKLELFREKVAIAARN